MSLAKAQLGTDGPEITRVGLGAWAMGGPGWVASWGAQDDEVSVATIREAVQRGTDWIDTAAVYGLGHSEEVVGRALREMADGERPYVFTKCGLVWSDDDREPRQVLAPESIRRECEASLRRLGIERIDLYQIHWPTLDGTPAEESWATMASLVDEGKVRWIGVSNYDVELLERCEAVRHVDSLQPQFSLLERDAAADVIPWCAGHGTGVIVYSPLGSGLLSGAFSLERLASLDRDDWRATDESFRSERVRAALALVERLRPVAGRKECSVAELAVAWTLAWPVVTGAIVGSRRPAQLDDTIGAGEVRLEPGDLDEIAHALEATGAGTGPIRPVEVASPRRGP